MPAGHQSRPPPLHRPHQHGMQCAPEREECVVCVCVCVCVCAWGGGGGGGGEEKSKCKYSDVDISWMFIG